MAVTEKHDPPTNREADAMRRTMRYWLARTARQAREQAEQKPEVIALLAGVDASTISRFESYKTWPQKLDRVIAAYAQACGIEDARKLWRRALNDWLRHGGVPVLGELSPAARALLLALEAAQRHLPHDDESPEMPNANGNSREVG